MSRPFFILLVAVCGISIFPPYTAAASKSVFPETVSTEMLRAQYAEAASGGQKVRILIVPGHEPGYGGTEFGGVYERELAVDISNFLAQELRTDPNFEVLIARGNEGWNDDFTRYFDRNMNGIEKYVRKYKKAFVKLVKRGKIEEKTEEVAHNTAPGDVALRLYGINKWANEHQVDLMIHVHLNDEAGHKKNVPGKQSGFAVYVPDGQYSNAKASKAVADTVFKRLNVNNTVSTMPLEDVGIVEDQELIALGAFNTSEVPSILIEYGYIYESKFTNPSVLASVTRDLAYATALGVEDFFGAESSVRYASRSLPYTFTTDSTAASVYALQVALRSLGYYPVKGSTLTECPVSGTLGSCTVDAITAFQTAKGIKEEGILGPKTRSALHAAFGLSTPVLAMVPAAASASCTAFMHQLELDTTDATTSGEVTKLQTLLAKDTSIYPEGKVTGYFGPSTKRAVQSFQTKKGITTPTSAGYGRVGPITAKALCS
jgi:peptidoglycan hydrolase-like protein with peptidoglycan-binding domain/N-acetylmuramoyl-L-alanine amidase